ncbi:actin cortical patch protein Sur7 [Histoplasma capsulatum var. duboisii H88]|uniref:Actin cortical patch protein Sur7 n=1 Tax=Ajellomyces capsulatus (strain H88) TaxID=544711 RepID=F0U6Y7_AJEC8|nr:actin cortical patch protein Sur7 [Histoplasma capsulatum var. duboisii H88]
MSSRTLFAGKACWAPCVHTLLPNAKAKFHGSQLLTLGLPGPLIALLGLLFTAGAFILMMLTLIGGSRNTNPLNRTWFLEADTSNIPGAPETSRWTFWGVCGVSDGKNDCHGTTAAFPLDPPSSWNFDTTDGVPPQFIGYYIPLRIQCFSAAGYVKGRNNFSSNGQPAKVGPNAFAWMWTAVALLFLSSCLYCVSGTGRSKRRANATASGATTGHERRGFFKSHDTQRAPTDGAVDKGYA